MRVPFGEVPLFGSMMVSYDACIFLPSYSWLLKCSYTLFAASIVASYILQCELPPWLLKLKPTMTSSGTISFRAYDILHCELHMTLDRITTLLFFTGVVVFPPTTFLRLKCYVVVFDPTGFELSGFIMFWLVVSCWGGLKLELYRVGVIATVLVLANFVSL